MASGVVASLAQQHAVQPLDLGAHRAPRRQQRIGYGLQGGAVRHQGQDALLESLALALADPQPKYPEQPAQLVAEIATFFLGALIRREGSRLLFALVSLHVLGGAAA